MKNCDRRRRRPESAWTFPALLALVLSACLPDLAVDESTIDGPRVLAVQVVPPEAAPGTEVTVRALIATPEGEPHTSTVDWAFCTARKPLSELGSVAVKCLDEGSHLTPIGEGLTTTGTLPIEGCSTFGPNPPEAVDGQAAGRPADADATGGYYQPLRVGTPDGGAAIAQARISCGVSGASQKLAAEMTRRYHPNANPALESLVLLRGGSKVTLGADAPPTVKRGETLAIRARWADCPDRAVCGDGACGTSEDAVDCPDDCAAPAGCTGAEAYVLFDRQEQSISVARESLRLSWYATGGTFAASHTGPTGARDADNGWTAPAKVGLLHLWVVVRDDRGGVGSMHRTLRVE